MAKQYKLTRERLAELTEELEYLKTVKEKEIAEQIKEARSFGDLSENAEYDEAKNEQGRVYSRVTELEVILANAVVIDESSIKTDEVTIGSRVVVEDMEDGSKETYYIVGSQEADPSQYRVSDESPLGRALVGKKVGDIALVQAPACTIEYKIIEINI